MKIIIIIIIDNILSESGYLGLKDLQDCNLMVDR